MGSAEDLTVADSFPGDLEIQEAFHHSECTLVSNDGDKNLYPKIGHRGKHGQVAPKM